MRGTPLDMTQYTRLFGTARVPTDQGCRIDTDPLSKHVVVLRRGQFFWFDVLDSHHRPLLTERALQLNLEAIVAEADKTDMHEMAAGAVGVLSTENRKVWAKRRDAMLEDATNRAMIEIVDSALFVVCLDDTAPQSPNELAESMLCGTYKIDRGAQVGTCCNRWYEKVRSRVRSWTAANACAAPDHSGGQRRSGRQL
jgi:carnitine O-acetyltransferase